MDTIDLLECSDDGALKVLGARFARYRLNKNLTQSALAYQAGVSRKTVSHLESGYPVTTVNLVRILRALGAYRTLDNVLPPVLISPLDLARMEGRVRQRARSSQTTDRHDDVWVWGD